MNDNNKQKELINEAISLIMKAEDWQIKIALEAAMNCQKKLARKGTK